MSRILKTLFLCTLGLLALQAQAREVDGVKYEENIELAGAKLQLNGAGTRYKAVFKVYTAGLYLGKKAGTLPEALAVPGPKRLTLTLCARSRPRNWAGCSSRASSPTPRMKSTRASSAA